MKSGKLWIVTFTIASLALSSCKQNVNDNSKRIIFLHHSTGYIIWKGGEETSAIARKAGRYSTRLEGFINRKALLPSLIRDYNKDFNKRYTIRERFFPKPSPYGWLNYPYDYYNIWVKNAGDSTFKEEPTLEILTKKYQVIIFKHCFPVGYIQPEEGISDLDSDKKTLSNYKLQYTALRDKLHSFPETQFIIFTGAALVESAVTEVEAMRTKEFFKWVIEEWDLPDDNIYLWDFYNLQTEGGLYFKDEYAASEKDSHPNILFAAKVTPLLFKRIIDIVETGGTNSKLTGEELK